ncbi:hypothetical protein HU200_008684 [Digitaria exilis]|uniref:C2H2-type domain-containing protein n=1 Tax=Digitaria exilis TaxID=1010633 RepID=A0A835FL97_9POAL|nr:hypothetical protein HU200_008684 [Digitaria exilis]
MDPLENVQVDSSKNATPFLEVSEISNTETRVKITVLENAKIDDTENGSGSGTDVHICKRCGKSFSKIMSLHGHMGSHLRDDDYKLIRQICGPPIPEESSQAMAGSLPISNKKKKKPNKLKHIWKASMALVEMSMAPVWQPKHGTATIDLSASVPCSSDEHGSGDEAAQMSEVAEFLTILVKRIQEETAKVPSPPSVQCYVCKICSKTFSSYQALGGHMSIHNKQKNNPLEDGSGSSIGSGVDCTFKLHAPTRRFQLRSR